MRCKVCGADKPPGSFANGQKKKPAGARKCSACAAAPANVAVDGAKGGPDVAVGGAAGAGRAAGSDAEPRASPPGAPAPAATTQPGSSSTSAARAADPTAGAGASRKFCAWAGCGQQLPADPAEYSKCGRCKQAFYCDRSCQKQHWGRGGHKEACVEPPCCTICLEGGDDPVPIQCGCACRGDAGLAHVACRSEVAARKQAGWHVGWQSCPTCGQDYSGAMRLGLAREVVSRLGTRRRGDPHRLGAANNLGSALRRAGELPEAAAVLAGVLPTVKRVWGKDHPGTIAVAVNLAATYFEQGKFAEAEELQGWVREASTRVNGKEHPTTLTATAHLAGTYRKQGRLAKAAALQTKVLEARKRVLGAEHRDTLAATANLAGTHDDQGNFAEAVLLLEDVLATSRRVLGAGHPDTRLAAKNLAITYTKMGKDAEAAELWAPYNCE